MHNFLVWLLTRLVGRGQQLFFTGSKLQKTGAGTLFLFFIIFPWLVMMLQSQAPWAGAPAASSMSERANLPYQVYLPFLKTSLPDVDPGPDPEDGPSVFGVELGRGARHPGLDEVTETGTTWVRRNLISWAEVEPEKGQRDWSLLSQLEEWMQQAAQEDLRIILTVRNAPSWAQKHPGSLCGPIRADELESYASFLFDLVSRYSVPPYNVLYWEMGNEPDVQWHTDDLPFGCWGDASEPDFGGGYYAEMLRQVYPRIKEANPNAQVLIGGLLLDCLPQEERCSSVSHTFLHGVLAAGGGEYVDAFSYHSHDGYNYSLGTFANTGWGASWDTTGPSMLVKTRYIKGILAEYGLQEKDLLLTEVSLMCYTDHTSCGDDFEETKSQFVVKTYTEAMAEGLAASLWFTLQGEGWRGTDLLFSNLAPRPAYYAYQFMSLKIQGATYHRTVDGYDNLVIHEMLKDNGRIWVAWSRNGSSTVLNLPQAPLEVWDIYGEALPSSTALTLGAAPVYIELPLED